MRPRSTLLPAVCLWLASAAAALARPYPILFVTQPPLPGDFTSMNAVFGNHHPDLQSSNRGGDLWVLYPNGHLKNLTAAAGFGVVGFQGANAIAVREPSVSWDGTKALVSMVVGAPSQQYQVKTFYWQIYEVTGLQESDTVSIARVPHQPAGYNNVSPIYGTDGRILFTSDRPRNGQAHLYPQLDEYESAPTVTGIWSLDPASGDVHLLNHTVSGVFSPSIDSFGRLVFVRWDHLQRDQQADADASAPVGGGSYGTFDYVDESASGAFAGTRSEVFPEPRTPRVDLLATMPGVEGQQFNQFFPWAMNEDGTNEETVNHLGRHDFAGYFDRAFNDNPHLVEFIPPGLLLRANANPLTNFLQMRESPAVPGRFYGVDAPEFGTHAAGQIVSFDAAPTTRADQVVVTYWTHRATASATPSANHTGMYRNPLPLSDGTLVVSHSAYTDEDSNTGTRANPGSRYDFRLKTLNAVAGGGSTAGTQLVAGGISKSISYYDPDVLVSYSGPLWELDPVEIRPRTKPATTGFALDPVEQGVFAAAGVDLAGFRNWLRARDLALIVTRNVTTRDAFDFQQPFNLRVPGGAPAVQTVRPGDSGPTYDVTDLQIVQADQIRGMGGMAGPRRGRRPIARFLHDPSAPNPVLSGRPAGSVPVSAVDGSIAAFVPARRALSWQLTDASGKPVVHERYWLTMQPGEIRACTSCHGMSHFDQAGNPPPTNAPQALADLLAYWKDNLAPTAPAGNGFFTVTPCRILDTRSADGASGGPALDGGSTRLLLAATRCGIPATATALSFNLTVTNASSAGNLTLYAGDGALPNTTAINFNAGRTRANNAVLKLSGDGTAALKIRSNGPGVVDVIVDVNGYFQ